MEINITIDRREKENLKVGAITDFGYDSHDAAYKNRSSAYKMEKLVDFQNQMITLCYPALLVVRATYYSTDPQCRALYGPDGE